MLKHAPSKEWFERQADLEDLSTEYSVRDLKSKEVDLTPGTNVMVFDNRLWEKNGGDSKTDSFMREATILRVYLKDGDVLLDVTFNHNGRVSEGHFARGVAEVV